ncbi:MAG: cysteine desulfurase [Marinilabiliaceae bacterium]|jgi:cysteine desulfurase/selenocysteine lyase|nr:cysteine desulfurase [Marinilabiliaceae bacterium]
MDIKKIRECFPILSKEVYNRPLVYFDNGATTQKPMRVIEAVTDAYMNYNSNIHRGVHFLSDMSSEKYEAAREEVRKFINAEKKEELVFTSGTTASINLVAFSFGEKYVSGGDEIIISGLEHHANIVPWQFLCNRKGAVLKVIPVLDDGTLDIDSYRKLICDRTKLIAVAHVSNSLGTVNPVKELISIAHANNVPVLLDGAQAIQHSGVDVQELDCDFYAFSGHKVYGPTGIGVLYAKEKWLEEMPPWQGGGDMVDKVTFEKTTYNQLPFKFEAGTTNFVGAIGLSEALGFINDLGLDFIMKREAELLKYATARLMDSGNIKIYGEAPEKVAIISFLIEGIHQYDAGMILDKMGIAVRTGTHCAQPLMDRFGIDGTIRASLCFYNTEEEVDRLLEGIEQVKVLMG